MRQMWPRPAAGSIARTGQAEHPSGIAAISAVVMPRLIPWRWQSAPELGLLRRVGSRAPFRSRREKSPPMLERERVRAGMDGLFWQVSQCLEIDHLRDAGVVLWLSECDTETRENREKFRLSHWPISRALRSAAIRRKASPPF